MPKVLYPTVRFYLKDIHEPETLIYLVFRYSFKGKSVKLKISTGQKAVIKHWNSDKQRLNTIGSRAERYSKINKRLDEWKRHTLEIYDEWDYGNISLKDFKAQLKNRMGIAALPDAPPTLFEFIGQHIKALKTAPNAKPSHYKKFGNVLAQLKRFEQETSTRVSYETIDFQFKKDFERWRQLQDISQNTIARDFSRVKELLRLSHEKGYHSNTSYQLKGFTIKSVRTRNKVRITLAELQQLIEFDFSHSKRLEKVRDVFYCMCFTGQRVSDWHKISKENLHTKNGNRFFRIRPSKTKDKIVAIPLLPEAEQILEKYHWQLPLISDAKFNKYIKEVCEAAIPETHFKRIYTQYGAVVDELTPKHEKVSSHSCRYSFCSNMHYERKISLQQIRSVTGHATERQLLSYIQDAETDDTISEFFE